MSESTTENRDLANAQQRLMEMLESVRLNPGSEAPPDRPVEDDSDDSLFPLLRPDTKEGCAGCGSLEPWGSSSWCPKCGYYPKIGRKVVDEKVGVEEEEEILDQEYTIIELLTMVPGWVYFLTGGFLAILSVSLVIRLMMPAVELRSPYAVIMIFAGLNLVGLAHVRAYMVASQDNEELSLISMFWAPFIIWQTLWLRMPNVRKTVYGGVWGVTAILCSVLIIGLDYDNLCRVENYQDGRGSFNPIRGIMYLIGNVDAAQKEGAKKGGKNKSGAETSLDGESASDGEEKSDPFEDALKDFAGDSELKEQDSTSSNQDVSSPEGELKVEGGPDVDSTADDTEVNPLANHPARVFVSSRSSSRKSHRNEYIVFGYLTNSSGELRSILVAEKNSKTQGIYFVGKYPIATRDSGFLKQFQETLDSHRSRGPILRTPYSARWTQPVVVCDIDHNGFTPDGRFMNGLLSSFLDLTLVEKDAD